MTWRRTRRKKTRRKRAAYRWAYPRMTLIVTAAAVIGCLATVASAFLE